MPKTWIFFFIIVVILIIASFLQSANKSDVKTAPSPTVLGSNLPASREANANAMLNNGDNTIFVTDQSSGLSELSVSYAVLSEPGFVLVRDDDHGMPGKIIGTSALLQNGRVENIDISLTDSLKADRVYYAELAQDDGDQTFQEAKDLLVSDQNKSIVLMSFQTSTDR